MKHMKTYLIILLGLIFNGCSVYLPRNTAERAPAQVNNEFFQTAFSFPASEKIENVDYTELMKKTIDEYTGFENALEYRFEFVTGKTLPKNIAYTVEMEVDPAGPYYIYHIYHSLPALQDRVATQSLMDFINNLNTMDSTKKSNAYFEKYLKAKAGDLEALNEFLKMRRYLPDLNNGLDDDIYQTEQYQKNLVLINNAIELLSGELKAQKTRPLKKK
jgi:hypothetical protein